MDTTAINILMQYWLLKTEPDVFSIDDLQKKPKQIERWDGIRNYQARNFIRDAIQQGDRCFIYHSQCKQVGIVGVAEVVSGAYPDPAQFDPENTYYDSKSFQESPRWFCMDIKLIKKFLEPVSLNTIKKHPELSEMILLKQGRLSIQPVKKYEWTIIESLSKTD